MSGAFYGVVVGFGLLIGLMFVFANFVSFKYFLKGVQHGNADLTAHALTLFLLGWLLIISGFLGWVIF